MTQQPPATPDAAMLSAEARAIGTLGRAADRLDCLIAQLDGREARLNAAADRAERNRIALAARSGDPTPEELAAGTRTTDRVLAPNTVTTDKESRPDAE